MAQSRPMEAAMPDLETIEKILQAGWDVISGAPINFINAVALVGIGIWLILLFAFKRQIKGLEAENKANDATILTLGERITLAQEQAEAAQKAQKSLEAEIDRLQAEIRGLKKAVERDAATRYQEVSADVKVATTATENAMERVSLSSSTVRDTLAAHLASWDVSLGALLSVDELTKDKDKD